MGINLQLTLKTVGEETPPEATRLLVLVQAIGNPERFFTVVATWEGDAFYNACNMVPIRQVVAYVELPWLEQVVDQAELTWWAEHGPKLFETYQSIYRP